MTQKSAASTTPLNIFFDELGSQVVIQKQFGNRLTGLFDTIEAAGWSHAIGEIETSALQGADVLVLTSRFDQGYTVQELEAIVAFVRGGKGLWCMSNHGPFNGTSANRQLDNFVRYDSAVASTFLTSYQAAGYQGVVDPPVPLEGTNLTRHPIILGNPSWPLAPGSKTSEIQSVVTRSFCGVYQNPFTSTIAALQGLEDVVNFQYTRELTTRQAAITVKPPVSEGVVWAASLEGPDVTGKGRVVIGADSGWLGNTDSSRPGPGQFQNGDNPQYALNSLAWLGQLS